jgi:hypothetical protein
MAASVSSDPGGSVGSAETDASEAVDVKDNFSLLEAACSVAQALKDEDYAALAAVVHPTKGVTFTPYSTVDFDTDLTFTPDQIRNLARDTTTYTWGVVDGRGSLIELTFPQYISQYVWTADYTQAPQIGVNRIIMGGNALENISDAYPDGRFIDFCFPMVDSANQGLDWCSLKLVFEPSDAGWLLVGIVHGPWTI